MAAKGTLAKKVLIDKIIAVLSEEYVGTADNKYYFAIPENGNKVQVAISMTCPKVELSPDGTKVAPGKEEGVNFAAFMNPPEMPIGNTGKREMVKPEQEEEDNKKKLLAALGF